MRRAAAILGALLLAGLASAQEHPSAESSWSALLLVLGGVVVLVGLIVGGRAAWQVITAPIVTLYRLEQVVLRPVEGSTGLVQRVQHVEATMASATDLDALRAQVTAHVAAHASDHAVTMAILKEIRSAVRAPGHSPDDRTEG